MRKKLLSFLAVGLFAWAGAQAQTDVTDTYLTSADFSSTTGWTEYKATEWSDCAMGKIGTLVVNSVTSTADAEHTTDMYCAGVSARWNSNYAAWQQTTSANLAAGVYVLTFDVENPGNSKDYNMGNLTYVKVNGVTYYDEGMTAKKLVDATGWTKHQIGFIVKEAAPITISLGYQNNENKGSADTPELFISNLKLIQSPTDVINADATSYISNPGFDSDLSGWTASNIGYMGNTGEMGSSFAECWRESAATFTSENPSIIQDITVPAGLYYLQATMKGRFVSTQLFATIGGETKDTPIYQQPVNTKFTDGIYFATTAETTVTIGYKFNDVIVSTGDGWMGVDDFKLTYVRGLTAAESGNANPLGAALTNDLTPTLTALKAATSDETALAIYNGISVKNSADYSAAMYKLDRTATYLTNAASFAGASASTPVVVSLGAWKWDAQYGKEQNYNTTFKSSEKGDVKNPEYVGTYHEAWNTSPFAGRRFYQDPVVPAGIYSLKGCLFANQPDAMYFILGNGESEKLTYDTGVDGYSNAKNLTAIGNAVDNELVFGIKQDAATSNWFAYGENLELLYFGATATEAEVKKTLEKRENQAFIDEATALLADAVYAVIVGEERTNLQKTLDDENYASLRSDINTFKDALNPYADLAYWVEEPVLPYASAAKLEAFRTAAAVGTPTSAADATSKLTDAIKTAKRALYESNALAEGVDGAENKTALITNPNMDGNKDGWSESQSGGNLGWLKSQPYTDSEGNTYGYFDYYNGDNVNQIASQVITELPAGKYILSAGARCSADFVCLQVVAGDKTADFPRIGNSGGVFGNGWNDATVEFVHAGGDIKIGVQCLKTDGVNRGGWMGCTRFRLVKLPDFSITTDGDFMTFSLGYKADKPANLDAYTVTIGVDGSDHAYAAPTKITGNVIPANTGLLIYGENGVKHSFVPTTAEVTGVSAENLLVDVVEARTLELDPIDWMGGEMPFVLASKNGGKAEFFLMSDLYFLIPANHAYLKVPASSISASAEKLSIGNQETTGIEDVAVEAEKDAIYFDLAGRRVMRPADHGFFIKKSNNGSAKIVR